MPDLQGRSEGILLVEDEPGVRRLAARILGEKGFVIFEAANAGEALDIFEREREKIRLAFTDVVLPDRTGLQLVDQLLSRNRGLRVLLSSGYADNKSQWPVIQKMGFHFIQKPYTAADLLQAIGEAWGDDSTSDFTAKLGR